MLHGVHICSVIESRSLVLLDILGVDCAVTVVDAGESVLVLNMGKGALDAFSGSNVLKVNGDVVVLSSKVSKLGRSSHLIDPSKTYAVVICIGTRNNLASSFLFGR